MRAYAKSAAWGQWNTHKRSSHATVVMVMMNLNGGVRDRGARWYSGRAVAWAGREGVWGNYW